MECASGKTACAAPEAPDVSFRPSPIVCCEVLFMTVSFLLVTLRFLYLCGTAFLPYLKQNLFHIFGASLTAEEREQVELQRHERALWFFLPSMELCGIATVIRAIPRVASLLAGNPPPVPFWRVLIGHSFCLFYFFRGHLHRDKAELFFAVRVLLMALIVPVGGPAFFLATMLRLVVMFVLRPRDLFGLNSAMSLCFCAKLGRSASTSEWMQHLGQESVFMMGLVLMAGKIQDLDILAAKAALEARSKGRTAKAVGKLLNSFTDAVLQLNSDLQIVNPGWQLGATLGSDAATLEGRTLNDFLPLQEDRDRFQAMCSQGLTRPAVDGRSIADVLHVSLQNMSRTVTFNAQIFHVPLQSGADGTTHMIGLCRCRSRGEEPSPNEEVPEAPEPPVQTLDLPRRARGPGSKASSRSSSRSASSAGSARGRRRREPQCCRSRASVNSSSAELEFTNCTDEFEEFCNPEEHGGLVSLLGEEIGLQFTSWLQDYINKALLEWVPRRFMDLHFDRVILRSRSDAMEYSLLLTATLPDPLLTAEEDYVITIGLEQRQLHLRREALEALAESPRSHSSGGSASAAAERTSEECNSSARGSEVDSRGSGA